MKRVICLLVVGRKHELIYEKQKSQFAAYAQKTGAEIKFITSPPDPSYKRSLLTQKMLIPEMVLEYDIALYLDLDIYINKNAPDIFSVLENEKSFAAVIDPRESDEFKKTWTVEGETIRTYFESRSFSFNESLIGSINGGVFVFRPKKVVDLFKSYYWSNHNTKNPDYSHEEAPIAYLTQTKGIFQQIDIRFNTQIIYKIRGTEAGRKILNTRPLLPSFLWKRYLRKNKLEVYPTRAYREYCKKILEDVWILHFAGNFPF